MSLPVCLPLTGLGLRRVRLAPLPSAKAGGITLELEEALVDNVPIVSGGIATLLPPVMAYQSVLKTV